MEEMNELAYSDCSYVEKAAKLYDILVQLISTDKCNTLAAQIAQYIKDGFSSHIDLNMICNHFAFSKNHIIQVFKKEFAQTPVVYLNTLRLRNAEQRLITESESIEIIAYKCGYTNYSHFYRQFVRRNGMSPEQYRSQMRIK